jgi:hypothetical protein
MPLERGGGGWHHRHPATHLLQCMSPLVADTVAKVVLQWWSEILRAADATFV